MSRRGGCGRLGVLWRVPFLPALAMAVCVASGSLGTGPEPLAPGDRAERPEQVQPAGHRKLRVDFTAAPERLKGAVQAAAAEPQPRDATGVHHRIARRGPGHIAAYEGSEEF